MSKLAPCLPCIIGDPSPRGGHSVLGSHFVYLRYSETSSEHCVIRYIGQVL